MCQVKYDGEFFVYLEEKYGIQFEVCIQLDYLRKFDDLVEVVVDL